MKIEILNAALDGNVWGLTKRLTYDDGTVVLGTHHFQNEALEWIAAEYGITDRRKIIEFILIRAEPGISEADVTGHGCLDAMPLRIAAVAEKVTLLSTFTNAQR